MRTIVIAIVALLVLGGGGYFGWQKFGAPKVYDGGIDDIPPMGSVEGQPVFLELGALTAPFVRDGKFAHYVVLIINLEVGDQDDIDPSSYVCDIIYIYYFLFINNILVASLFYAAATSIIYHRRYCYFLFIFFCTFLLE